MTRTPGLLPHQPGWEPDTGPAVHTADFPTLHRRCESCGGAMPPRMHRQKNTKGQLVCDNCQANTPRWASAQAALLLLTEPEHRIEFYRREAEAVSSILRTGRMQRAAESVARGQRLAHDMGDGGVVNHCCFCGSGAVVGGSDGSVECGFCFAGETEYLTFDGPRTLKETVGTTQRVLVSQAVGPDGSQDASDFGGVWMDAQIQSFGVQSLTKVTLRRTGETREVYATPEHRWLVTPATSKGFATGRRDVVVTSDLHSGMRLAPLFGRRRLLQNKETVPSPFGETSGQRVAWKVVSVEETDRVEEVYCAVVPDHENFTLVGNINVMNCHTVFSVQVQPNNPSMPQTVNGQPFVAPGMPAGEPTEMSEPKDPVAEQADQAEGEDPSGPQQPGHPSPGDPNPSSKDMVTDRQVNPPHQKAKGENPFAKGDPTDPTAKPGDPKVKGENPFAKSDDGDKADPQAKDDDKGEDGKKKNLPPWLKKKTSLAVPAGWTVSYNSYREPFYEKSSGGYKVSVWEIASMPGHYQWQMLSADFMSAGGGTEEDITDSLEEACAAAEAILPKTGSVPVLGSFRTSEGVLLNGESYLKRLALQHGDDRDAVLAQIRKE